MIKLEGEKSLLVSSSLSLNGLRATVQFCVLLYCNSQLVISQKEVMHHFGFIAKTFSSFILFRRINSMFFPSNTIPE